MSLLYRSLHALRSVYRRIFNPLNIDVRCIVVDSNGHVLLVRHSYVPGWYFPGGGVEKGESLVGAAVRELKEEVGVVPHAPLQVFHVYSDLRRGHFGHVILFSVDRFDYSPRPNLEIEEAAFFDPAQPPQNISPATGRRLAEWRGEKARADTQIW